MVRNHSALFSVILIKVMQYARHRDYKCAREIIGRPQRAIVMETRLNVLQKFAVVMSNKVDGLLFNCIGIIVCATSCKIMSNRKYHYPKHCVG